MTLPALALIGAPIDCGKRRQGCLMGPDALRTAGLGAALVALGYDVTDHGNIAITATAEPTPDHLYAVRETIAWTEALSEAAENTLADTIPIFLGGDHAMSLGTIRGRAHVAAKQNRPQFVLWLDAHTDYHTPQTTTSGHLHGTPLGYVTGRAGFDGFPPVPHPVPYGNIAMIGLRSVDKEEREALQKSDVSYIDMRHIDEHGIAGPLAAFLDRVKTANGVLHVSLDADFLDPTVAPAVGTTVPGGATIREAHLVMEMICDSGLMTSMDIAELNPFLDERGRTAQVLVDLVASAFGRRIFDRSTRAH